VPSSPLGKYALVIGMPIGIVEFLQGTDGKYALVVGMPIGVVDFLQGTDGKYALVVGMPIGGVNPEYDTRARPLPKTTRV